jgi:hypothetical protein
MVPLETGYKKLFGSRLSALSFGSGGGAGSACSK